MIFYRATDADFLVHWLTVRTEAKAMDKDFTEHDIDTSKPSIQKLLNDQEVRDHYLRGRINILEFDANIAPVTIDQPAISEVLDTKPSQSTAAPQLDCNSIVDWLIDVATQAQVETVFAYIGVRWGQARKK